MDQVYKVAPQLLKFLSYLLGWLPWIGKPLAGFLSNPPAWFVLAVAIAIPILFIVAVLLYIHSLWNENKDMIQKLKRFFYKK